MPKGRGTVSAHLEGIIMRKWMACGRWLAAWVLCGLLTACGGGSEDGSLAGLQKASLAEPQTGIWWNPSASGSGYAVERQGSIVTLGAYLYEADGRAVWYVGPLSRLSNGDYQGALTRYAGGQSLTGTYRAPSSSSGVATVTFSLTTATSGSLAFVTAAGSHTVPVQRFALTGGAIAPSTASFESGLWWNDAESGRGFFIDVQGTTAALASYMYDGTGNPVWYLTVGTVNSTGFSGTLEAYQGGQALGATYRAPASAGQQGTVSFRAITATSGELTLPGGRVVPVKRLVFASSDPGTGGGTGGTTVSFAAFVDEQLLPEDVSITGGTITSASEGPLPFVYSYPTASGGCSISGSNQHGSLTTCIEREQAAVVALCSSATALDPRVVLFDKARMVVASMTELAGRTFATVNCTGQRTSERIVVAADGGSATYTGSDGSETVSGADLAALLSTTGKPYTEGGKSYASRFALYRSPAGKFYIVETGNETGYDPILWEQL